MNDHLQQPEQDYSLVGNPFTSTSSSLSQQDSAPSVSSANEFEEYEDEDTTVPYLELPSNSSQQAASQISSGPVADSQAADPTSSSLLEDPTSASLSQSNDLFRMALLIILFKVMPALLLVVSWVTVFVLVIATHSVTGWGVILLVCGTVVLGAAFALAYYEALYHLLRQKGVTVEGRITGRYSDRWRGSKYYHLTYSYRCDGMAYSRDEAVSKEIYHTLHEADRVEVRYLPADPTFARLATTL